MMDTGERKYEGASLQIAEFQPLPDIKVRQIVSLETEEGRRNMGDASKLLKIICQEADLTGTILVLQPKPGDDCPLDATHLAYWYRRYGFSVIQTEPVVLMSRVARQVKSRLH